MADDERRSHWWERRKESRRAKRDRKGDTPEKQRERPASPDYDPNDSADRAGHAGFISGGFGGSAG